jgi:hypothetical protein
MPPIKISRAVVVGAVKLGIFTFGVYAICAAALSIERASSPTSKDVCLRPQG